MKTCAFLSVCGVHFFLQTPCMTVTVFFRFEKPTGANADLRAVWQGRLCLHLQKVKEVLLYIVCQTVRIQINPKAC